MQPEGKGDEVDEVTDSTLKNLEGHLRDIKLQGVANIRKVSSGVDGLCLHVSLFTMLISTGLHPPTQAYPCYHASGWPPLLPVG